MIEVIVVGLPLGAFVRSRLTILIICLVLGVARALFIRSVGARYGDLMSDGQVAAAALTFACAAGALALVIHFWHGRRALGAAE